MGDRANFGVKQGNDIVYLYGHWAGDGMLNTLAHGLDKVRSMGRLDDIGYATRILFSQIVNNDWPGALGWGIFVNQTGDNEHKVPVVDFYNKTVTLYAFDFDKWTLAEPVFTMSIDNFIRKFSKQSACV